MATSQTVKIKKKRKVKIPKSQLKKCPVCGKKYGK